MQLQEQCCTVEQGKRLVELGVPKEGVLFWHMPARSTVHGEYIQYGWHGDNLAPAFNVAELGELLPKSDRPLSAWSTRSFTNLPGTRWEVSYNHHPGWYDYYTTEAQARASLLIHLLENNVITFKPDTATIAE